jgi:predicted esterase
MSLVTGLQLPVENKVAGLLVMSGYLPAANTFRLTPGFEDIPILHCHGLADPMVRYSWAEKTKAEVERQVKLILLSSLHSLSLFLSLSFSVSLYLSLSL